MQPSIWIKDDHIFPNFDGWQDGYGAFTYSRRDEPELIAYLQGQEEHHRKVTFLEDIGSCWLIMASSLRRSIFRRIFYPFGVERGFCGWSRSWVSPHKR